MESTYIKRDSLGCVDINASKEAFGNALETWVKENDISIDLIETAVEEVFDTITGRLLMPALITLAVNNLNLPGDKHNNAVKRVQDYIKSQKISGRLHVGIGRKDGGVKRLAKPGEEIPAKTV